MRSTNEQKMTNDSSSASSAAYRSSCGGAVNSYGLRRLLSAWPLESRGRLCTGVESPDCRQQAELAGGHRTLLTARRFLGYVREEALHVFFHEHLVQLLPRLPDVVLGFGIR